MFLESYTYPKTVIIKCTLFLITSLWQLRWESSHIGKLSEDIISLFGLLVSVLSFFWPGKSWFSSIWISTVRNENHSKGFMSKFKLQEKIIKEKLFLCTCLKTHNTVWCTYTILCNLLQSWNDQNKKIHYLKYLGRKFYITLLLKTFWNQRIPTKYRNSTTHFGESVFRNILLVSLLLLWKGKKSELFVWFPKTGS